MTDFSGRRFPFAECGEDVTIFEQVRLLGPEAMHVGSHVIVDDFVFIDGRAGMTIGDYVHIAGFVSIIGQGETIIGDFCSISAGCRLVTGTDAFDGSALIGPPVPDDLRNVHRGRIELKPYSALATGVIVHPDVVIGEGAVVGSGSLVLDDVPPWTICFGSPAKPIRERPRETVLAFAAETRRRES